MKRNVHPGAHKGMAAGGSESVSCRDRHYEHKVLRLHGIENWCVFVCNPTESFFEGQRFVEARKELGV